ncbi:MAG: hypothetical protein AD742_19045 [Methylibium sp. NZG]|nr:MAG: hypothetical protein AD742_19045 [Methylibium sp. NZG]
MTPQPLTHHEIIGLAEPFTRGGRQVDLAASNRLERRLVFKRAERALQPADERSADPAAASVAAPLAASLAASLAALADTGPLTEVLHLDSFGTGTFRLTRTLTHASGLQATLEAMGPEPAALLARVDAVPPQRQFRAGPRFVVARSYALEGAATPVLRRGVVQADGLNLTMTVSAVRGVSADITLAQTTPGPALALPEDLLAVLGWDWARLIRKPAGWASKMRLRGGAARRTHTAEAALDRAAAHLAQTLAEPPARFHERHVAARRGVVLRRAIPLMTPVLLVITVLALPRFDVDNSPLWVLLYHVPTVCILLSFRLQELPQFEIPPWPRRSQAVSWRPASGT